MMAYRLMPSGSPCAVPLGDLSSCPPTMKRCAIVSIYCVAIDGHNTLILCRAAALFKELKAFE